MILNAIPKIYALGHRHTQGILSAGDDIRVQEKIDGSQFSFCWWAGDGNNCAALECRSKGAVISGDPGMFRHAVDMVQALALNGQLPSGYVFQCEYLAKPKHNVLAYACIPTGFMVLFDVRNAEGKYVPDEVPSWAKTLGLMPVPTLFVGSPMPSDLQALMERESVLGGCKIEGLVIKNYSHPHPESSSGKAPMTAKIVSDRFKEKHSATSVINPKAKQGELVQAIVGRYRTEARWLKAIQHLKEAGKLVNGPEDIGPLLKEIEQDVLTEDGHDIAEVLLAAHWKDIAKGICAGFPQFYKAALAGELSVFQHEQINKINNENQNEKTE